MRRYSRRAKKGTKKLRPMKGGNHGKIYVFYHVYCNHNTAPIVKDQCLRIILSNLYKRVDAIYCFLVGQAEKIAEVESLLKNLGKKFKVAAKGPDDKSYERFTLEKIPEYVKPEDKFLYIHSKGVTDKNFFTGEDAKKEAIFWWRTWMEYFLMTQYETCIEKLNEYDIIGVNYSEYLIGKHFSGNFWWTTGKYYLTLPKKVPDLEIRPYNAPEVYIFKGTNPRHYDMDSGRVPPNSKGIYEDLIYSGKYVDF